MAVLPALLALLALPAAVAPPQVTAPDTFESAARRAQAAREATRDGEAIAAYQSALALRPDWDEGLWYLGTLLYQSGRREEADAALARFLLVKPQTGAAWVLRGFCAFETGDFKASVDRLDRGLRLGLGGNAELDSLGRLRLAQALVKTYQFEAALPPLTVLARGTPENPEVRTVIGLALLRMALLPSEIPPEKRDLVLKTGRAGAYHLGERGSDAEQAYADLVAAYPDEPWVHYAQGAFLLRTDSERAVAALKRELRVNPGNVLACLDIAFELLKLQRNEEARTVAERAVEISPTLFATHAALGRALVETGEVDRGIRELELAAGLAPESPEVHFALARAYARAGREPDAARERGEFARLDRERTAAGGATPGGAGEVRP
ncbi:MAG TPA: tetratricopeptide repeat protein [Vicinamibacteria bacterium]|nr:tetratricopeptide repeat protein [Vicinamibacteria bacterium]